jgi:hypothetical protein
MCFRGNPDALLGYEEEEEKVAQLQRDPTVIKIAYAWARAWTFEFWLLIHLGSSKSAFQGLLLSYYQKAKKVAVNKKTILFRFLKKKFNPFCGF